MKLLLTIIILTSLTIYPQEKIRKILFVGNSLTYSNNLPEILEYIALKFNENIETTDLSNPNYCLEDHWNDGNFQRVMVK